MTHEQYQRYIEQTFDAYCKAVIRNAAIDILRREKTKREHEISLSEFTDPGELGAAAEDTYSLDETTFSVHGINVTVHNPDLSEALTCIPAKLRDVVLMAYFLGLTESEIAHTLHLSQSTINERRTKSLRRLRKIMEALCND